MAIIKRAPSARPQIDITGPDGNAFALLGYANRFCKELGRDAAPVLARMKSGNYEHLLEVFDEEFGSFVDLVR
ncbi:MAG: hypothetical protein I8H71_01395 [Xanthomonadaceae bacterium]|nr:hypothetical protein [Xanthomonadaceae bacterium]